MLNSIKLFLFFIFFTFSLNGSNVKQKKKNTTEYLHSSYHRAWATSPIKLMEKKWLYNSYSSNWTLHLFSNSCQELLDAPSHIYKLYKLALYSHRLHYQAPSTMTLYGGVDEWSFGYTPEWKLDIYTVFSYLNDMRRGVERNLTAN